MRDFFRGAPARSFTSLGLEELADGIKRPEVEKCFVARIQDASLFKRAIRVEYHEQYGLDLPAEPLKRLVMRVRKTIENGQESCVLTFKPTEQGANHPSEIAVPASTAVLELLKTLKASSGMKKTRYVIVADEAAQEVWEIDVFTLPDGSAARWCKVDFEFKGDMTKSLPPFPSELVDVIDIKTTNPEDKAFVDELFKTVFST